MVVPRHEGVGRPRGVELEDAHRDGAEQEVVARRRLEVLRS